MIIYRVKIWAKIFSGCLSLIFTSGAIAFLIFNKEASIIQRIIITLGIPFSIIGPYPIYKIKIIVSDAKIETISRFIPRIGSLYWNEIAEVSSEYFLFPETGVINLIPKQDSGKTFLRISIWGMPIELVRDILSRLPSNTKVYLYPYLKRKAEGKQTWFYRK